MISWLLPLSLSAIAAFADVPQEPPPADWQQAVDAYMESRREFGRIPGVALAVVRDGKAVYLQGYGSSGPGGPPVTPQTPFVLGSVSKAFTALAVVQLAEDGQIDLDQPVVRYLPTFRVGDGADSSRITVRQLLNQTSGLSTFAGRRLLADPDSSDSALERHVAALAETRLSNPPGIRYEYSNANYTVAGLLVQSVSGMSYEDYIRRRIFEPLEMSRSFLSQVDAERKGLAVGHRIWFGQPVAAPDLPFTRGELPAAYICSSAEDMSHWLIAHLNQGKYQESHLVTHDGLATLHTPPPGNLYAMGWSQAVQGHRPALMHLGEVPNYRAQALLVPSERLGVVTLMNVNNYLDQPPLQDLAPGVAAIILGEKPATPTHNRRLTLVYGLLAITVAMQLAGLAWSIRLLKRWRRPSESRPRSRTRCHLTVASLLIVDLTLFVGFMFVVPAVFDISLAGMLFYQPDVSWICVALALFSLAWGLARSIALWRSLPSSATAPA